MARIVIKKEKTDLDIDYIANLARLELSAEEKKDFARQLAGILDYINKLNELDVAQVKPTSHVLPLKNITRQDMVKSSLKPEEALKNAPAKEENFFKVPKVIGG